MSKASNILSIVESKAMGIWPDDPPPTQYKVPDDFMKAFSKLDQRSEVTWSVESDKSLALAVYPKSVKDSGCFVIIEISGEVMIDCWDKGKDGTVRALAKQYLRAPKV